MKASFRDSDGYSICSHDKNSGSYYSREFGTKNNNYIKNKNKKVKYNVAYDKVKEILKEKILSEKELYLRKGKNFNIKDVTVTLEYLVNSTNIRPSIIKKVLMQLNREGVISKAINNTEHGRIWVASKYKMRGYWVE